MKWTKTDTAFASIIGSVALVCAGIIFYAITKDVKQKPIIETRFYILDEGCVRLQHHIDKCYYYLGDRLTGGIFLSDGQSTLTIIKKGRWQ